MLKSILSSPLMHGYSGDERAPRNRSECHIMKETGAESTKTWLTPPDDGNSKKYDALTNASASKTCWSRSLVGALLLCIRLFIEHLYASR